MSYEYEKLRYEELDDLIHAANELCEGGSGWRLISVEPFGGWWYGVAEKEEPKAPSPASDLRPKAGGINWNLPTTSDKPLLDETK